MYVLYPFFHNTQDNSMYTSYSQKCHLKALNTHPSLLFGLVCSASHQHRLNEWLMISLLSDGSTLLQQQSSNTGRDSSSSSFWELGLSGSTGNNVFSGVSRLKLKQQWVPHMERLIFCAWEISIFNPQYAYPLHLTSSSQAFGNLTWVRELFWFEGFFSFPIFNIFSSLFSPQEKTQIPMHQTENNDWAGSSTLRMSRNSTDASETTAHSVVTNRRLAKDSRALDHAASPSWTPWTHTK